MGWIAGIVQDAMGFGSKEMGLGEDCLVQTVPPSTRCRMVRGDHRTDALGPSGLA